MKIQGSNVVPYPVEHVWEAMLDPRVLVATIPGCDKLEVTGENAYDMTVTAGVASIKGTYTGTCALSNLQQQESLVMRLQGAGAPGTVDATVEVSFDDLGDEGTRISYEADAVVGGMVGGVGQRMLSSVSRRMATEFFTNIAGVIAHPFAADSVELDDGAASGPTPAPKVFSATAQPRGATSPDDFVKGLAIGAGLVLLGVIAGASLGRRR